MTVGQSVGVGVGGHATVGQSVGVGVGGHATVGQSVGVGVGGHVTVGQSVGVGVGGHVNGVIVGGHEFPGIRKYKMQCVHLLLSIRLTCVLYRTTVRSRASRCPCSCLK